MKINALLIIAITFLASSCSVQYAVESATVQEWVGGAPGSGGGSNYVVSVGKKGSSQVTINSVWLGDREKGVLADFRVFADSSMRTVKNDGFDLAMFRVETSVKNRRRETRDDPGGIEGEQAAPSGLPAEFQKGMVINYINSKGKEGHLIIQDFKRLEPLIYP